MKLSKKLPDILLESFFIVIALLGALALDEWREDKEKMELADSAKHAIIEEIKDNKKQLDSKLPVHQDMLKLLNEKLEYFKKTGNTDANFDFSFSMAIITSAAWDTARMTQSAQFMTFDEVRNFSKVYKFQELYVEHQQKLIEMIMQIGDLEDDEFPHFTKGFVHRLELLIEINEMLSETYGKLDEAELSKKVTGDIEKVEHQDNNDS
ncbi:hypothetical protein [Aliikangiella sp. G2MR2-5]|uniref:hypothetical protein n=1 Tax=Aliikangiella sp. G2MR2-5 TaxID=2788943 RepID=UPI0018A9A9D0|nr:hypothetical protein [Aliikangiella sp. G2MR2-5]